MRWSSPLVSIRAVDLAEPTTRDEVSGAGRTNASKTSVRAHRRRRRRSSDAVRIVAVTKTFGVEAVRAALAVGLVDIGENYADELVSKASALEGRADAPTARWHFLGAIQRNKIARLARALACSKASTASKKARPSRGAPRGGGLRRGRATDPIPLVAVWRSSEAGPTLVVGLAKPISTSRG